MLQVQISPSGAGSPGPGLWRLLGSSNIKYVETEVESIYHGH